MLQLYNRERSGNCYKARLMLSLLGLEYESIPVQREGKGRNIVPPDFERLRVGGQTRLFQGLRFGKPVKSSLTAKGC